MSKSKSSPSSTERIHLLLIAKIYRSINAVNIAVCVSRIRNVHKYGRSGYRYITAVSANRVSVQHVSRVTIYRVSSLSSFTDYYCSRTRAALLPTFIRAYQLHELHVTDDILTVTTRSYGDSIESKHPVRARPGVYARSIDRFPNDNTYAWINGRLVYRSKREINYS